MKYGSAKKAGLAALAAAVCVGIIAIAVLQRDAGNSSQAAEGYYASKDEALAAAVSPVVDSLNAQPSGDAVAYTVVHRYQNCYFVQAPAHGTDVLAYCENLLIFAMEEKDGQYLCRQISPILTVYQEDETGAVVSPGVIYTQMLEDAGLYVICGKVAAAEPYVIMPDQATLLDSNLTADGTVDNPDRIMVLIYPLSKNPPASPAIRELSE